MHQSSSKSQRLHIAISGDRIRQISPAVHRAMQSPVRAEFPSNRHPPADDPGRPYLTVSGVQEFPKALARCDEPFRKGNGYRAGEYRV